METWFLFLVTLSICLLLKSTINLFFSTTKTKQKQLPPGPKTFPIIGNIIWLKKSFFDLEPILRSLHAKFGPIVTIHIGSRPAIFVADRSLAYKALVQNGALYADRPPAIATGKIVSSNQHNVSSAPYGPTWRTLRRNLTAEILHPSRVKSYSHARKWVLDILMNRLESQEGSRVCVIDDFQYAMFCLLVLMCFGDKLGEEQIKRIETVQRNLLLSVGKFNILNFWPSVTRILLRKRWEELFRLRRDQEDVLLPLIRARKKMREELILNDEKCENHVVSYVDTLLELELPIEKRKMNEDEIVSCCSEFLNAGTDTTSTALQWIMANLVKYPHIQEKLFVEIKGVLGEDKRGQEVKEEDLQKMPYLKAIILEGLRRHPPGHFVLPHAATEDMTLDKYAVPKKGTINFMVAEIGWDPSVWEDPMAFKPERFIVGDDQVEFDITGSREIKMMPFGVGRRMCPGYALSILHLEYFVANLVWSFEWKKMDEQEDVDLSEKQEFTVVMKNPLQAHISRRFR